VSMEGEEVQVVVCMPYAEAVRHAHGAFVYKHACHSCQGAVGINEETFGGPPPGHYLFMCGACVLRFIQTQQCFRTEITDYQKQNLSELDMLLLKALSFPVATVAYLQMMGTRMDASHVDTSGEEVKKGAN
jgi:hypothetical protein